MATTPEELVPDNTSASGRGVKMEWQAATEQDVCLGKWPFQAMVPE
jgi:hypothetical protein